MSGSLVNTILEHNAKFAKTLEPPVKMADFAPFVKSKGGPLIVITCLDPRVDAHSILGLDPSQGALIYRNAGGRTFDAIRSLVGLQVLLGAGTIAVMQHTDCGMTHATDDIIRSEILKIVPEKADEIAATKYGAITVPIEESVREDVAFLRDSPFVRKETTLIGLKYDTHTGVVTVVE